MCTKLLDSRLTFLPPPPKNKYGQINAELLHKSLSHLLTQEILMGQSKCQALF